MIPGLSVFWVIFFVLLLTVILDRLLFKPLTRVTNERQQRVKTAVELAAQSADRARAAASEFEQRTTAAQAAVYRQMDETRRAALERRSEMLARTRQEVEASIAAARASLARQASTARAELESEADTLAEAVATRVLGRRL